MRVGVDARILAHPKSGISTYLINLLKSFLDEKTVEIILFSDKPIHPTYLDITDRYESVIFGQKKRKYWAQFLLPFKLKKYDIDIYHAVWNNGVPIFSSCPAIVNIFDLVPWRVSGYFKKYKKCIKYKLQEYIAAHRACRIITCSQHSKTDIVELLHIVPEKVKVIYLGLEHEFRDEVNQCRKEDIFEKYGINKDYIITIGGFDQPRRNARTLVKIFDLVIKKELDIQLVIVGKPPDENAIENEIIQRLKDRIIFTEHISQQELDIIISNAHMMVLPSLYEGFGLPVLEAMAYNVPVITTNISSIPEVAGDAAIMLDVDDMEGFVNSIVKLYSDKELRSDLIKKGKMRAGKFNCENAKKQTLQVYKDIMI